MAQFIVAVSSGIVGLGAWGGGGGEQENAHLLSSLGQLESYRPPVYAMP